MKRDSIHIRHNQIRPSFLLKMAVCWLVVSFSACTDEDWSGTEPMLNSNMISFQVTSGITSDMFSEAQSRAADDTTDLLQPLLLKSPELEHPLYLHTYVAEEYERSTGTDAETRGVPVEDMVNFVSIAGNKFNVEAWYADTGGEFMPDGTEATPYENDNKVWSTATKYYWPGNDRKLHFAAYAPQSATGLTNLSITKANISFDYTVPKGTDENGKQIDAEKQPDLMFAISECSKSESVDGKAPLNFRHALSAIKFAVRDVVDGTIEKITISGVYGSGHCVYQLPETDGDGVFTWSNHDEANTSYSQQFDYKVEGIDDIPSPDGSEDIVLNDTKSEMTFMLIPQEISADAKIEIVFKREDGQSFTLSGYIRDNNVTKWEPGKEYIYTISTSSSNWTYHFEVIGCEQKENDEEPSKGGFEDAFGKIVVNQTVIEGAYYKVKSYRERANNPNIKEPVAWKVSNITDGTTTFPDELSNYDEYLKDGKVIDAEVWLPNINRKGNGSTSTDGEKYNVTFYPQMVGTSWEGDWKMRTRKEKGAVDNPFDLSTVNGLQSTANCYVVNGPGYYKLPLVYGNAIKNGQENQQSWQCSLNDYSTTYPALKTFTDYKGNAITAPQIIGSKSVKLVWQDAYNLISDVNLNLADENYGSLSFKVNSENLQQGNAVLAVCDDNGIIMWSWHIWVTEHWTSDTGESLVLGTGDVICDAYDSNYGTFDVAPYNLGWCDPKDVWYLKRTGEINFKQDVTNDTERLEVEQRECKIEYWIGNNVYFQFGRKDPIVGFMNSGSVVKYNFGKDSYGIEQQPKDIQDGIQHPNVLFVGAAPSTSSNYTSNDWLKISYYNLWNNTSIPVPTGGTPPNNQIFDYHYSGVKTIYDPSPVGYQVPPVGFFKIITPFAIDGGYNVSNFNGDYVGITGHDGYYIYTAYAKRNKQGDKITLTGTGHRWYTTTGVGAGGNFNPFIVYLWSNQIQFSNVDKAAYGLALGGKSNGDLDGATSFRFPGRRSMARPIRPVKEFNR